MADAELPLFRDLYDLLMEYAGKDVYREVLLPWTSKSRVAVSEFARFRKMEGYATDGEEFWSSVYGLYALGRVNDLLLLSFQDDERGKSDFPRVSREQYLGFFSELGFTPVAPRPFCPFHHEIVRVRPSADDGEPISVTGTVWPGLMFGEMLFSRCGVEVAGGRRRLVKAAAESSTLYFAHRRLHRPARDLSRGWGGNSQWGTPFRRDYERGGRLFYNVDGKNSLNAPPAGEDRDGLSPAERLELCRHRCLLVSGKDDGELWPYDDRYEEPYSS